MKSEETVELPVETLAEHAVHLAYETDAVDTFLSEDLAEQWYDLCTAEIISAVESADVYPDGHIEFEGKVTLREAVRHIPAGPNQGYGPINPPETVTEPRDVLFNIYLSSINPPETVTEPRDVVFNIYLSFEDIGIASMTAERI